MEWQQYYTLDSFLRKYENPVASNDPVHERFVKNVMNDLGKLGVNGYRNYAKVYRGVDLMGEQGFQVGSVDLAVLTPEEFIIVEAKVRSKSRWRNTWHIKEQLCKIF